MDFKHNDLEMEKFIERTSLHIARLCVRNTIIEKYHVAGKLSDPEMEAFNREVTNKLYSYLQLLFNPKMTEEKDLLFKSPYFSALPDWDKPIFDQDFKNAIKILKEDEK